MKASCIYSCSVKDLLVSSQVEVYTKNRRWTKANSNGISLSVNTIVYAKYSVRDLMRGSAAEYVDTTSQKKISALQLLVILKK